MMIIDLLDAELSHLTQRNHALPTSLQVFIALRYYASGSFQSVTGDTICVSKSTVSRVVRKVSVALANRLNDFVQFPGNNEFQEIRRRFYDIAGFPGVMGVIDGTHVQIMAPSLHEEQFVNRKNYHSINVQVCCNHKNELTNLVVKWPGATHDARVLRESILADEFEGNQHRGVLLGDSGYPCKNWLMVPFLNPINDAQRRFNQSHKSTHSIIERTIGMWKRRFPCVQQCIRMTPERACKVIAATAVLHNMARRRNLPDFLDDNDDGDNQPMAMVVRDGDGNMVRNAIVRRCFQQVCSSFIISQII